LWARFSAYSQVQLLSFVGSRVEFPLSILDPRPEAADGTTIEIADARTYFEIMLTSAQSAIDAYETFISKYQKADDADRRSRR
jgi:hypothetical protein